MVGRLLESRHAELRSALLLRLLERPGVLDFIDDYDGDGRPTHVAEAAASAGLRLDDVDTGLLALTIGHVVEAAATAPVSLSGRWLGGGAGTDSGLIERWQEMTVDQRINTTVELMTDPEILALTHRYRGPAEPAAVAQFTESYGIPLTDAGAVVLATILGWPGR